MRLDRSTKCREAIEGIGISRSIHQVSRRYRDCNKKKLGSSTDSQMSRRCRGGVELAFTNNFLRREKHRHECNQASNSTNDPNTKLTSQNHLSTTILSTWIPKTHTHTLNRSNQFCILKIS